MKHNIKVTITLLSLFLLAQIVGLSLLLSTIQINPETQEITSFGTTTIGERPETQGITSIIILLIGITIGTLILLYLAKKNHVKIWKAWFFIASLLTVSISVGVITNNQIAWIIALILVTLRFYKPNILTTNLTEILMYAGLTIFLVPILDIITVIILLIIISIYDMYAVWKSKHMIKMARFTSENQVFPGLSLSYHRKEKNKNIKAGKSIGIIGGGDVVFPLLLAGSTLTHLISKGFEPTQAFIYSSTISIGALFSLIFLFYISKKDKFYPAMPFISTGSFISLIILFLLI